jgi:hypothetical protein
MQICEILAAGAPHWATQHIVTASRQQPRCQFVQPCRPNVACLSGFDNIGLAYSANSTGCNSSKSLSGTQDVELSFQDTRRLHLLVVHLGLCCLVRVITMAVTFLSFHVMPHCGHLDCVKHIYGYLYKMCGAMIHIHTDEPDYSRLPDQDYDWARSIYRDLSETIPDDAPPLLGKHVTLTHYFNANLYHDMITGHLVTSILHLFNKTTIEWYLKKQATIETATYRSEFVAAHMCIDQINQSSHYPPLSWHPDL